MASKFNWQRNSAREAGYAAYRSAADNAAYAADLDSARVMRERRRHWSPERWPATKPLTKEELRKQAAEAFADWRKRFGED